MEMEELKKNFENYVDFVSRNLKVQSPKKDKSSSKGIFRLISSRDWETRQRVQQLVEGPEFSQLVKKTQSAFSEFEDIVFFTVWPSYTNYFDIKAPERDDPNMFWFYAVHNFLCRSGFYQRLLSDRDIDIHDIFDQFCAAFRKKEIKTKYIAPMVEVDLSGPNMDFGSFQMRKYKADELERMFGNETNKIFYPEAFFNNSALINYWFIVVRDDESLQNIRSESIPDDIVSPEYTRFPKKLESALRSILLYDWILDKSISDKVDKLMEEVYRSLGWSENEIKEYLKESRKRKTKNHIRNSAPHSLDKFSIPFVLKWDDNLLTFPKINKRVSGSHNISDHPLLDHDRAETRNLKDFLVRVEKVIKNLEIDSEGSEYLDIAFGYMIKAFFSEGVEELAFSIMALEALLGEKGKEVTETLSKRISTILGNTDRERDEIKREFKELYDFRCSLSHGRRFRKPLYEDHLRKAREYIRKTLLWYLYCLNHFKNKFKRPPTRKEIIGLIDIEKGDMPGFRNFLNALPKNFPNVPKWANGF